MSDEIEVLDRSVLKASLGEDKELINEIYDLYIDNTNELIQSMEKAAEECDLDAVGKFAHSIKGSSANIGAKAVQQSMIEIETACENKNLEEVQNRVHQSRAEYSKLLVELNA